MHADNRSVDHLHSRIVTCGKGFYDAAPYANPPPSNKAIVAGGVRTKVDWQVPPRRARSQDPEDAVENTPIIHSRHAARLIRQHRLNGRPFIIREFVAHDSSPRFRGLNHGSAVSLNQESGRSLCTRKQTPLCSQLFLSFVTINRVGLTL